MRKYEGKFGAEASRRSQGADRSPKPEEKLKMLFDGRTNSLRGLLP